MTSTPDIHLRALEPEDLELAYRIENDPSFWRYSASTVPYSRYALREYIASVQNDIFADGQVRLVIMLGEEAVGFADLTNFDALHLRAEIGLAILPEHQEKHIGERAVQSLLDYARSLHIHQLYATIATTNKPASRLFERLAFEPSAYLKDWLRAEEGFVDAVVWQQII
ncbi:MAG: GNAT family N-acetyltransferase [Bacteroidaceae bacterium]|nr:GNAT family N-acetyltransferase [Bacteroidaceae bacterium]